MLSSYNPAPCCTEETFFICPSNILRPLFPPEFNESHKKTMEKGKQIHFTRTVEGCLKAEPTAQYEAEEARWGRLHSFHSSSITNPDVYVATSETKHICISKSWTAICSRLFNLCLWPLPSLELNHHKNFISQNSTLVCVCVCVVSSSALLTRQKALLMTLC